MADQNSIIALTKLLHRLKLVASTEQYNPSDASGKDPIAYFSSKGLIDEIAAVQAVADSLGIQARTLDQKSTGAISGLLGNPRFKSIELSQWRALKALPVAFDDKTLEIICANPFCHEAKKDLEFRLGISIKMSLGFEEQILSFLDRSRKASTELSLNSMIDESNEIAFSAQLVETSNETQLHHEDVSAPLVIRLVDKIFSDSLEKRASDIHISPEKDQLAVRVRVDGMLHPLLTVPAHLKNPVVARIKLLCGMDISEKRKPQDGRLRLKSNNNPVDLRISTVLSVHGENVVVRVLATQSTKHSLDAVGMRESTLTRFTQGLRESSKVVLVSGPTGSGKTSTLYAGLTYLADGHRNIITIEDPIEYRIDGVTQMQVNRKIDVTFAEGLRSALRQDPDVIMVGEIRDLETATVALQASQTGHLVLSTIHTNSAPATITRLVDLGVAPYLLASSISTIVAQRLVRKLCTECRTQTELGWKACGCPACANTGYKGRHGVFSVLELTDAVQEVIRHNGSEQEITNAARPTGYETLWEDAIHLIEEGITTYEEAERVLGPQRNAVVVPNREELAKTSIEQGKRRLLLVEDDDSTRTILSMLFKDQFFDVIEAENGLEGLEMVHSQHPEIIVCDLMMPRMSGIEMLKKLRADTRTRDIPVLMLTAASTEDNELALMESGADDFVSKTTDSKVMLARVNRLLARLEA